MTLFLDFETFSEANIKFGAFYYSQHATTEIICMAYCFGTDGAVKLWTPDKPFPKEVKDHIEQGGILRSWNCTFEYSLLKYTLKINIKPENCACSMTDALALALPASLEKCGEALNLEQQKDKRGKYLIQRLSKIYRGKRITYDMEPEWFEEFYNYCIEDVKTEIAIYNVLPRHIKGTELDLFRLTLKINERGLPIDNALVDSIMVAKKIYEDSLNKEIEEITEGLLVSTNSRPQSLKWLSENGLELEKYDKKSIKEALEKDNPENVQRFLEIRSELSRTPIKKFDFLKNAVCADGTIKNNLIFHKATTGRFSGSGFQIQNLPRDASDNPEELVNEFLSGECKTDVYTKSIQLIRSVIKSDIVVSDFASIENRVLAWCSRDFKTLKDFIKGVDQYKTAASGIFNVNYKDVTKDQRHLGKIAVLGCGYGAGAKAFRLVCEGWNVFLSEDEAKEIVDGYRFQYKKIVSYWYTLYETALDAVRMKIVTEHYGIKFRVIGDYLYMRLPSGRLISYYKPKAEMVTTPWGAKKLAITHMGNNTYTRKWERLNITPGRLTENVVQAIARDMLTEAMVRVEENGFKIIACVHDEVIAYGSDLETFNKLMEVSPSWALDCPIKAEGFKGNRYRK